jgi:hypothetical protein
MHAAVSHCLAALMLIHSLLGCCWHHAQEEGDSSRLASFLVDPSGNCQQHPSGHSDHHQPGHPCKHHDDGTCPGTWVYFSSGRPQVSKTLFFAPLDSVVALPAMDNADRQLHGCERAAIAPASRTPMRLHLLNQILLI